MRTMIAATLRASVRIAGKRKGRPLRPVPVHLKRTTFVTMPLWLKYTVTTGVPSGSSKINLYRA
jgi:hypothetical protein